VKKNSQISVVFIFLLFVTSCATTNVSNYFSVDKYILQKGDTLTSIAFRYEVGLNKLLKWNKLHSNSIIKPGQIIYVKTPINNERTPYKVVKTYGITKKAITPAKKWTKKPTKIVAVKDYKNKYNWSWPVANKATKSNKKRLHKGLNFTGEVGQDIKAVSDGTVIYSGRGIKYGNLVIIKYNKQLLTAYFFNKKNLVRTEDKVKQGQVIATMGVKNKKGHLYFEVRKNGKPTNPLYYLKPR
jgi:lipoprotein NlpD